MDSNQAKGIKYLVSCYDARLKVSKNIFVTLIGNFDEYLCFLDVILCQLNKPFASPCANNEPFFDLLSKNYIYIGYHLISRIAFTSSESKRSLEIKWTSI